MSTPATPTPARRALPVPVPAGHLTIKKGDEVGTIPATERLLSYVKRCTPGTQIAMVWHSALKSSSGRHVPLAVVGHVWPDAVVLEHLEIAAYELAAQIAGISPTVTAPLADIGFNGTLGEDLEDEAVEELDGHLEDEPVDVAEHLEAKADEVDDETP